MDVEEVKKLLGLTTTKYDTYLQSAVPLVTDFAKQFCNQDFLGASGQESLPGGVKMFVAKAAEYNMQKAGVTSRSMGDVAHTFYIDFPESIKTFLRAYKRVGTLRG